MEKKRRTLTLLMAVLQLSAMAQFTTAGDGTTYTVGLLAATEGTGIVTYEAEDSPDYQPTYVLTQDITIADGDRFQMDDDIVVRFAQDVTLTVEGGADFRLAHGSVFDRAQAGDQVGASVCIKSKTTTEFEQCTFRYVGLELMAEGATHVRHCHFADHDGSTAAALYFITAGAESTVEDCTFEHCRKAAIGSAANAPQPLVIKDCTLTQNSTLNSNVPQINITAASPLVITGCAVTGNPENNMVGGIGISNFMGYEADVTVSQCTVRDNRYGIGLVGPAAHISIEGNTFVDNRYETNPMNGGSGISLYDPYQQTSAVISGNHIEGSLWGVTIIGCQAVNLGHLEKDADWNPGGNTFKDNGNGGQLYDLYNNSTITVYAESNTWNVAEQTQEEIEKVIFHKADDPSLGEVIYWPAAASTGIDTQHPTPDTQHPTPVYDLNGLRRTAPVKGINIIHGKKVVY